MNVKRSISCHACTSLTQLLSIAAVLSVPAAKRRKLATPDPELQSPEAAADAAPAGSASPADSAAALATDAAAAPPLHRISSSGAGLTTAEALALSNSHQRGAAKVCIRTGQKANQDIRSRGLSPTHLR